MCCSKSGTAEILFEKISNALRSNDIDWSNYVGLSLDNTSVDLGRHNFIKTRVQEVNNSIYINGSPCHIVHNTANKVAEIFMLESGFDVGDMLVAILHWFDKSSKRKVELEEFGSSCDQEHRKIMKHVSTRWLSLETAVTPTLRLYQPLQSYFLSQKNRPNCLERLEALFADLMTDVFLFFYQYALQSFVNFDKYLKREELLTSRLHDQIQQFLERIACKFIQIVFVANGDMFSDAWRKQENQKSASFDL